MTVDQNDITEKLVLGFNALIASIRELLRGPWPDLLFIRHGHGFHQFAWDLFDQKVGDSPLKALGVNIPNHKVSLTPYGREQAIQTGRYLRQVGYSPDCVYYSWLERAKESAELIFPAAQANDFSFRSDWRIREKDFGVAHLQDASNLAEKYPDFIRLYELVGKFWAPKVPGGDTYMRLLTDLHSMLTTLRRDWSGKKVAIICHSAVMMAIRVLLERHNPEEVILLTEEQQLLNCSLLHYRRANAGHWAGWTPGKSGHTGRFRLELDMPPYIAWYIDKPTRALYNEQALTELEEIKKNCPATWLDL
ncbi:histidine phosphatase family protein [Patescibacteria group bacterium]